MGFSRFMGMVLLVLVLAACAAPAEPVQTTAPVTVPPTTVPETTAPTEPEDPVAVRARELLSGMTEEERICQLLIVTRDQWNGAYPVGGIIYFASDLKNREQCIDMIRGDQARSRLGLFISVDEEGGIVSRLGANRRMGITDHPNMGKIGKQEDPAAAYEVGCTIGSEIGALGFNLDFAPVADVNSNPRNPVIGVRAFHSDPQIAAELVAACVAGFRDSGMLCTLKHFPGHGDIDSDSHYGEVSLNKTLEELEQCELVPFRAGIGAGADGVMVGHITVPALSREAVPATLSHEIVTELLRRELGFEGLVITDSMSMEAVTDRFSSGEAAVRALRAGVDIILMPEELPDAVSGIRAALAEGTLTWERVNESVLRILETKLRSGIIPME